MSAEERWCCPICGTPNSAEPGTFAAEGWCQGTTCANKRGDLRQRLGESALGWLLPEIRYVDRLERADA